MFELIALAIAPAIFILWYIYKKDCYEPEPLHLIAWIFFLGALSTIPALILEYPFPDSLFTSAVVAPVAEELVKFSVVFLVMYRHPEFDEPMDGIVYAAVAGLGFATVENIFYVLDGGVTVGVLRAIMSVPGHVIFACIWGFALGMAKFHPESSRAGIIISGLFGAMLLHGIFNFSLEVFDILGLLLILLVLLPLGWWMTNRNIQKAQADPCSACSAMKLYAPGSAGIAGPLRQGTGTIPVQSSYPPAASGNQETKPSSGTPGQQKSSAGFCTHCGKPYRPGTQFCENCGNKI